MINKKPLISNNLAHYRNRACLSQTELATLSHTTKHLIKLTEISEHDPAFPTKRNITMAIRDSLLTMYKPEPMDIFPILKVKKEVE